MPGGFSLGLIDDSNGDGWRERSARRTFTIRTAPHASGLFGASESRATFVALGDVVLEGIVEASGRVLREDGSAVVGARVFALRSVSLPVSDEGPALVVEQAADGETATDSDGAFAFPALPAGTLSFVAFADDGAELLASEPAQQEASPGDDLEIELRVSAGTSRTLASSTPACWTAARRSSPAGRRRTARPGRNAIRSSACARPTVTSTRRAARTRSVRPAPVATSVLLTAARSSAPAARRCAAPMACAPRAKRRPMASTATPGSGTAPRARGASRRR